MDWFWIVLLISAVLYFRWLLVEMNRGTDRLAAESEKFQDEIRAEKEENQQIFQKFYGEMNRALDDAVETIDPKSRRSY